MVRRHTVTLGGALPVTVPAGYTGDAPAPLIILLHTYGRTGAVQDEYMGLSALADAYGWGAYGFILVAAYGTPSAAEDNPRFWNASAACWRARSSTTRPISWASSPR